MRKLLFGLLSLLAFSGCAAPATGVRESTSAATVASRSPAHLDGTQWRFVKVAGAPVPTDVTATMRLEQGRASGKAGCNAYGASYEVQPDGRAHFEQAMSTKMACLQPPGAMQVERNVFEALRNTAKVQVDHDELVLEDAQGHPLATLVRSDSSGSAD